MPGDLVRVIGFLDDEIVLIGKFSTVVEVAHVIATGEAILGSSSR